MVILVGDVVNIFGHRKCVAHKVGSCFRLLAAERHVVQTHIAAPHQFDADVVGRLEVVQLNSPRDGQRLGVFR